MDEAVEADVDCECAEGLGYIGHGR
jgi:hypothetical protein